MVKKLPAQKLIQYGIAAGSSLTSLSQKDLDQYFQNLQSLGVKWVRWDISWNNIQPAGPSDFRWAETDRVASAARRSGITSLGIITYSPRWAAVNSCSSDSKCEPNNAKAFGRFAGEVALRYKDSISYWEIWNEPNTISFWKPKPNTKNYSDILREAYTEIKRVNPQSFVLSGGMSAIGNEKNGSFSPFTFITSLYALQANLYFDAVALHPYTYPASPNSRTSYHWQEISSIHQLMVKNGDQAKKIWITEYGAPTGGPGTAFNIDQMNGFNNYTDFMTESAQTSLIAQAATYYNQNSAWLGPFFWYSLRDSGTTRDTTENFYGLLRFDWSKKPAFNTFRSIINP